MIDKTNVSARLVDQLNNTARINLLVTMESDSANCSLVWAKDHLVLVNTTFRALSCSVFMPEDGVIADGVLMVGRLRACPILLQLPGS